MQIEEKFWDFKSPQYGVRLGAAGIDALFFYNATGQYDLPEKWSLIKAEVTA